MNHEQLERMKNGKGFIAALDQSGGSTPKALANYGVLEGSYHTEAEMFDLVHEMRTRIMTDPAFNSEKILGAILFEQTMDRQVDGQYTADYLWSKGIVPFLKIDQGLAEMVQGSQMMKEMPELDQLLKRANERHIFGTKERSNITEYNEERIREVVQQQFAIGKQVIDHNLVPIIEPEVNIHAAEKEQIERYLKQAILEELDALSEDQSVMLKLTLPTVPNEYLELVNHPRVVRVVALSGGYSLEDANDRLRQNKGMIASFSRALSNDLRSSQTDKEFHETLSQAIDAIYDASVNKI